MPSRYAEDGTTSSTTGSRHQAMATLFHVTGGYTYVGLRGEALGYEDVFTKLEHATM
jgi:hypothetical protein